MKIWISVHWHHRERPRCRGRSHTRTPHTVSVAHNAHKWLHCTQAPCLCARRCDSPCMEPWLWPRSSHTLSRLHTTCSTREPPCPAGSGTYVGSWRCWLTFTLTPLRPPDVQGHSIYMDMYMYSVKIDLLTPKAPMMRDALLRATASQPPGGAGACAESVFGWKSVQ